MKFKPTIKTLTISLIIVIAVGLFLYQESFKNNVPLYIAIVVPQSGDYASDGKSMIQGANLYIDKINKQGGVNGKKVELLVYDDQGDSEKAKQTAMELAKDNRVLAVLGHFFSSASLSAGKIYQEHGIPAITSASSADEVTVGNEWYFRIIPHNRLIGIFLANYTIRVMNQKTVSIIYDSNDVYSTSLVKGFKTPFKGLGGKISHEWNLDSENKDEIIEKIVTQILRDPNGSGLIFMACQESEAEKLIVSMKRKGIESPIIGGDVLGGTTFANRFNQYSEEQAQPGYFTDGIYANAPIIFDAADKATQDFREEYFSEYKQEPDWRTATSYDATMVIVEAIAKTAVQGTPENLSTDRKKIRDYLARLTNADQAIKGVSGDVYFDKQRNVVKPVTVGLFNKQQFISALTQFRPVINPNPLVTDFEAELKTGRIVSMAGQYMYKTNVVYTGIYFNEISNVKESESSYEMDFYLWFRYQGDIDASNIQFINSIDDPKKVELGSPVIDKKLDNGITYQLYRVKGKFTEDFDFYDYPFDKKDLTIRFRHTKLTRENLIYVADVVGLNETANQSILEKIKRTLIFQANGDWTLDNAKYFQDSMVTESSLGNPQSANFYTIKYSKFNSTLTIKRNVITFIIRNLLPVFFVIILAYLGLYVPTTEFEAKMGLISGSIMTIAFFHYGLSSGLPGIGYTVALDYAFYVVYGLMVFELFVAVIDLHKIGQIESLEQKNEELIKKNKKEYKNVIANNEKLIKQHSKFGTTLTLLGRISYPIASIILFVTFVYVYKIDGLYPQPKLIETKSQVVAQLKAVPDEWPTDSSTSSTSEKVVLRLGSWRIDDIDQINEILAVFNKKYPNIMVKFEPAIGSRYGKILSFQLENGTAPDIFYLSSPGGTTPTVQQLFEDGYLEPLNDLPNLKETFRADALDTWSKDGQLYAVPLGAVSHGIFYNVTLFNKLNLKIPTNWNELLTTAETIKKANIIPFANGIYPMDKRRIGDLIFVNLAPTFIGGREGRLKYASGERCFNDEHVVAIYQAMKELAPFLPEDKETLTYYNSQQLFLQGQAAMWLGGSWDISLFEKGNPSFDWSVFAIPPLSGGKEYVTYHIDSAIGLNAASPYKKEAKQFLEWLATPEFADLFGNKLPGFFPLQKNEPMIRNQHANAFLALNKGRETDVRWNLPVGLPNGRELMQDNALELFRGKITPQQAADNLQSGLIQWYEPAQKCQESP